MNWLSHRFGRAVAIHAPHRKGGSTPDFLFLVGPQYNKEVLLDTENFRPTGVWPITGKEGSAIENLRRNILRLRGAEHAAQMKPLKPHISRVHVNTLFERVKRIAISEIDSWPVGETADVQVLCRRLAHHYAFGLLFGEENLGRVFAFGDLVDQFHAANWSRCALLFPIDVPGSPYRRVVRQAEALQAFVLAWAEERRGCPQQSDVRAAMISGCQADGQPLTPAQVAGNLCSFAMASYETSAGTLAWALFLLAQHPKVMGDLLDELSALPAIEDVDQETLSEQPLLNAVIKETVRLITPVPVLGFCAIQDCQIAGNHLEANARVFVSPHMTHRLPELYDQPDQFRPERWLTITPSAFEYLPFSAGPRSCPGYWFAVNNLRTALATVVLRYRLTVKPNARIDRTYAATTAPKSGIPMDLAPQDRKFSRSPCSGSVFDLVTLTD